MKFTEARLSAIATPSSGRLEIGDDMVPGLLLRVNSSGSKSFVIRRRLAGTGNPVRVTLGRYPDLSVDSARRMARTIINQFAEGIDPRARKRADRAKGMTLRQVCEEYLTLHRPRHKESYQNDIKRTLRVDFASLADRPVVQISANDVVRWHQAFASRSNADKCAKLLRALLRFASDRHDLRGDGIRVSTDCLRILRLWSRTRRRQTVVRDMSKWLEAVYALPSEHVRDLLVTLALSGLRRDEWRTAVWSQIDLERGVIVLPDPKNREQIELPVASQVLDILQRRYAQAGGLAGAPRPDEPVFSTTNGRVPITRATLAKAVKRTQEAAGKWALHDLRRGFISLADTMVPLSVSKRLVGHLPGRDAHDGYVVIGLEQLRRFLQTVAERLICRSTTSAVVDLATTMRGLNEQQRNGL